MKNWEFYEKELKEYNLSFAMKDNKIYSCRELDCPECAFYRPKCSCNELTMKWLYQEHKEPIVLTDDEKSLCKLLGRGWIARDNDDDNLYWYEIKPKKKNFSAWLALSRMCIGMVFPQCKFEFIKWEDEEPWEVKIDD
jgi:hypothetical protein